VIRMSRTFASLLFFAIALPVVSRVKPYPQLPTSPSWLSITTKRSGACRTNILKAVQEDHYPVLKKEMEMGRIAKVWMDQPRYHTRKTGAWDYRVTIVFKNASVANEPSTKQGCKSNVSRQETFQREEQRRSRFSTATGICR